MQLATKISLVTLAVSTAALALVLWLVITQPWVVEEPVPVVATPTFTEDEVLVAVRAHIMRNGDMLKCYALSAAMMNLGKFAKTCLILKNTQQSVGTISGRSTWAPLLLWKDSL